MADYTQNFNLEKPAQSDFYNIEVQNKNMDKIDEELKKLGDADKGLPNSVAMIANKRTDIQENEDLNDFLNVGCFRSTTNARTRSLSNCPTDLAFTMDVVSGTGWHNTVTAESGFILQKILDHGGNSWIRPVYASNGSIFYDKWIKTTTSDGEFSADENAATIVSYTDNDTNDRRVLALCNQNFKELKEALRIMDATNGVQKYYQIFGDHNKPNGTYSGNGNASQRTITTNGKGKVVLIFSGNGVVIATPYGGFAINNSGTASFIATSKIYTNEESLIITTDSVLVNGSGKSYPYYVL